MAPRHGLGRQRCGERGDERGEGGERGDERGEGGDERGEGSEIAIIERSDVGLISRVTETDRPTSSHSTAQHNSAQENTAPYSTARSAALHCAAVFIQQSIVQWLMEWNGMG
jgi:hypothetical protein